MNNLKLSFIVKANAGCVIKNYFGESEKYKHKTTAQYFGDVLDHWFTDIDGIDFDLSRADCLRYLYSLTAQGPKIFDTLIRKERSIKQEAWVIKEYKEAQKRWKDFL